MKNSMRNRFNFYIGTEIVGKWHRNKYTIIKELGSGANGIVYLAEKQGKKIAIKISDDPVSIMSEVNVLKSFLRLKGVPSGLIF